MAFTLVTFHAHPDDESLLTAGVMAKAAAEGHRVVLVVATAGEVGEAAGSYRVGEGGLGRARIAELQRSAAILGVHRLELLGYRDSGLGETGGAAEAEAGRDASVPFAGADVEEAAERLAAILRDESADVVTVYDANGGYGHPDHVQVHRVGHRAAELAGTPVVLEATINRDLMRTGVELAGSLGYEVPPDFSPASFDSWFVPAGAITHAVDVQGFLDAKRASMEAHASQATSSSGATRSLSMFLSLPPEYFSMAFGTEWFVERGRTADPASWETDVFASCPR